MTETSSWAEEVRNLRQEVRGLSDRMIVVEMKIDQQTSTAINKRHLYVAVAVAIVGALSTNLFNLIQWGPK